MQACHNFIKYPACEVPNLGFYRRNISLIAQLRFSDCIMTSKSSFTSFKCFLVQGAKKYRVTEPCIIPGEDRIFHGIHTYFWPCLSRAGLVLTRAGCKNFAVKKSPIMYREDGTSCGVHTDFWPYLSRVGQVLARAGCKKYPVNELQIMSREDEISLNPRSLYIVVVGEDEDIYSVSCLCQSYRFSSFCPMM